jgi:RNA polymerase sigma-70 factor (ECF subfamily)
VTTLTLAPALPGNALLKARVARADDQARGTGMTAVGTDGLVGRARAGDQQAWASLYRAAYPRLIAFAYHRLGCVDQARDAVSETMARAVTGIGRFDRGDEGFTPWLVGICRNVVGDVLRTRYRRPTEPLADDYACGGPGPDEGFLAGEDRRAVRAAFERLDPDERELLALRVVAGMSADEVATILGKKPGAIRMAQMRALGRLRIFVEEAARVG